MKSGSLIKFSKDHYTGPGLDYCKDWIGIILDMCALTLISTFDTAKSILNETIKNKGLFTNYTSDLISAFKSLSK